MRASPLGLLILLGAHAAFGRDLPPRDTKAKTEEARPAHGDHTAHYWDDQAERSFVSAQLALGALNRLLVSAGYGRPHYFWGGGEAQALTTTEFGAVYSGLRLELLIANLTLGGRYTWAYTRRLADPALVYEERDLADPSQPLASYASLDASLWGFIPGGPTFGYWEVSQIWLPGKPSSQAVFEEYTRFTITRDAATMLRFGWCLLLYRDRFFVGPAADLVLTEDRDPLVRLGGNASFQFTEHLSLMAHFTVPVASPDQLDWFTQSWGIARLTYKWATGEPAPGFP